MSSSTPSSFGYHEPKKQVEKSLDIYKLIKEKNSLTYNSKASGINISYATPYIHKKNNIAKCYQKTLATIKDSLVINSEYLLNSKPMQQIQTITSTTNNQLGKIAQLSSQKNL